MNRMFFILPFLAFLLGPAERAVTQASETIDPEIVTGIKEASARYLETFNRHDAAALAELWVEDATYVTPNGKELHGRKEIEAAFKTFFEENPGVSMESVKSEILTVSGEWAVGEGVIRVMFEDETFEESEYLVYLKKVGGEWLIQAEGEKDLDEPPPASFFLKDLEWLIGDWKDEGGEVTVETSYNWSRNKNSVRGHFRVNSNGEFAMDGWVRIAWDPIEKHIRSWTFDSDGGDAEGVWYTEDGKWYVKRLHVLPDGRTGSSVYVLERIDRDSVQWTSVSREVGGDLLPDVGPVKMIRVQESN